MPSENTVRVDFKLTHAIEETYPSPEVEPEENREVTLHEYWLQLESLCLPSAHLARRT